eukprot:gene6738-13646_t
MSTVQTFDGVDEENEYLDLSKQSIPIEGIITLFDDVAVDDAILHLNISYNLSKDELRDANKVTALFNKIIESLQRNKVLTALDIAGNHLGDATPQLFNNHTLEYISILSKGLATTKITHLDISDNNILGDSGRIYKPLTNLIRNYVTKKCLYFKCQYNHLHSQAFRIISEAFVNNSNITHLDLSNNIGGLDPFGHENSEGIIILMKMISHCHSLRVLKLANNRLRDDDIVFVANALLVLPSMRHLDIANNSCHIFGSEALKQSILAHAVMKSHSDGLKTLDISGNPLDINCIEEIMTAIKVSDSMRVFHMENCSLDIEAMTLLRDALYDNIELRQIFITGNNISETFQKQLHAETAANAVLEQLQKLPLSIDIRPLSTEVLDALRRKLRFLSHKLLRRLHENDSFEEMSSPLREQLYVLSPPLRKHLLQHAAAKSSTIKKRMEASLILSMEVDAARVIYRNVIRPSSVVKRRINFASP